MNIKSLVIFIVIITTIFVVLAIYIIEKETASLSESNGLGGGGDSVSAFYDV